MSDYDYTPREKPSIYLRLKSKGDKVTIRIASPTYRAPQVWREGVKGPPMEEDKMLMMNESQWMTIYRDPQYSVSESFHWVVIDRADGQAKIFTGSPMVYNQIKKYANTSGWGDPKTYDIEVERTEQAGRYYEVTPLPAKSPLIEREESLVQAIKVQEKLPSARMLSDTQVDHISAFDGPSEPAAPVSGEPKVVDDVIIEDIDEPINIDDIPF